MSRVKDTKKELTQMECDVVAFLNLPQLPRYKAVPAFRAGIYHIVPRDLSS